MRAHEDRAGVVDVVENSARLGGLHLEVLGPVGVAEGCRGREVVDEHDRRLLPLERGSHAIAVESGCRDRRSTSAATA